MSLLRVLTATVGGTKDDPGQTPSRASRTTEQRPLNRRGAATVRHLRCGGRRVSRRVQLPRRSLDDSCGHLQVGEQREIFARRPEGLVIQETLERRQLVAAAIEPAAGDEPEPARVMPDAAGVWLAGGRLRLRQHILPSAEPRVREERRDRKIRRPGELPGRRERE